MLCFWKRSSPIQAFKDTSEDQITLTQIAVFRKFVRDVVTISLPITPNLIMDASSLVGAEAETKSGAIVAISGVLIGEVKKVVKLEIVGTVILILTIWLAVTHLFKSKMRHSHSHLNNAS